MVHNIENILAASAISKFFPGAVALDKVDFTLRVVRFMRSSAKMVPESPR